MRAFNAKEAMLATTLLPLALGKGWISKTVLLNGMAYHGASALGMSVAPLLRKVDVLCNVSFCVLVNAQTQWQPHTGLLTALAVAAWGGDTKSPAFCTQRSCSGPFFCVSQCLPMRELRNC